MRSLAVPPRGGRGGYDAIVVGSGAAGAVLAYRFAEAGRRVLVLERGPHVDPHAPASDETGRYLSLYRGSALEQTTDFGVGITQGDCVGGGTTVGHGLLLDPPSAVLDAWATHGFDKDGLAAALTETRQWLGIGGEPALPNAVARRFAAGAADLGGETFTFAGSASVLDSVLARAQADFPGQVEILADCAIDRIVRNGDRVAGVAGRHADRETVMFPAREVVVAAGAIGSNSLLLGSGIGGPRAVQFDIELDVFADFADFAEPFAAGGTAQAFVPYGEPPPFVVGSWSNSPAAQALTMPGWLDRHIEAMRRYRHIAATGVHVGTTGRGRMKTSRRGPLIDFTPSDDDRARLARGLATTAEILFGAGAERVMPAASRWCELHHPGEAVDLPHDALTINGQPLGGNAVGEIVDEDFRVRGVANLYVCDASVFPSSVHVPPQLTVMAVAHYAAKRMLVPAAQA